MGSIPKFFIYRTNNNFVDSQLGIINKENIVKKLAILLSLLIVFACEDKDADGPDCASLMTKAEQLSDTFETKTDNGTATKADCDAAVEAMEAAVDCLPAGPDKTELLQMLPVAKASCNLLS